MDIVRGCLEKHGALSPKPHTGGMVADVALQYGELTHTVNLRVKEATQVVVQQMCPVAAGGRGLDEQGRAAAILTDEHAALGALVTSEPELRRAGEWSLIASVSEQNRRERKESHRECVLHSGDLRTITAPATVSGTMVHATR